MRNAELIIRDSKGLGHDIWQMWACEHWMSDAWKKAIGSMTEAMQKIYHEADRGLIEIDDADLYSLGDVINLLNAIDISTK